MKITTYNFKEVYPNEAERLQIYKDNLIIDGEFKRVVPLDQLFCWEENPKKSTVQDMNRLEKMTRKLGQFKSLIVEENGQILGGNHRKMKWEAMGFKFVTIEVVYPKTEDERVEYALADNDHIAEYDQEALAEKLKALKNIDLDLFKVNLAPLSKLSMLLDKFADPPKEDEVPPLPTVAVSREGELYQLGKHRLYCGDSTKEESYKILMDGKRARMVFTDPPYNINYEGQAKSKREGIMNDNMTADKFREFLVQCLTEMVKVTDGAFYVCMSPQELYNLHPAFITAGGHFQGFIIWVKNNFNLSGADFQSMYEPILYGWPKDKDHYFAGYRDEGNVWTNLEAVKPRFEEGCTIINLGLYTLKIKGEITGEVLRKRDSVDIWEVPKTIKNDQHPTMKPVKLVSKALRASSERSDLVLDPFGGSGSTLIAAEETGRICNMMELDPRYIDVIIERWEKLTGEKAVKLLEVTAPDKK